MKPFKSDNYIFRTTPLADALVAAGLAKPQMIREAKREGVLRQRSDSFNQLPSVRIELSSPRDSKAA